METKLKCKFKIGQMVRWNSIASTLNGSPTDGWKILGLQNDKGLQPVYRVSRGKDVGWATEWDLEAC